MVLAVGWVCEVVCAKRLGELAVMFPRVVQVSASVGVRSKGLSCEILMRDLPSSRFCV